MKSRTYTTTLVRDGSMCIVPVPFDPVPVFGKVGPAAGEAATQGRSLAADRRLEPA